MGDNTMNTLHGWGGLDGCKSDTDATSPENARSDIYVQLAISAALGITSFLAFCFLRPRWKTLYAARKRQTDAAAELPDLPNTFFGWMPVLYKVTEEQVLASAGLDAFVFLSFFKMSIKFLGVAFLLAATIIAPINKHYVGLDFTGGKKGNQTESALGGPHYISQGFIYIYDAGKARHGKQVAEDDISYLWAYLVFTYVFTALAIYFLVQQTRKIIKTRQDYLGSQYTITDRTIKLSGIPKDLRSEEQITEVLEKLQIGKVENVTICRDWKRLDELLDERAALLRKLEEAITVHLANHREERDRPTLPRARSQRRFRDDPAEEDDSEESGEGDRLIRAVEHDISVYDTARPMTRIWTGKWNLKPKSVDAIAYYEEKLERLDKKIREARKKDYRATALAFVTMDSIPAAQMAVQALIDPSPMQFLATLAPAPSDIVWANTYQSRRARMMWSWTITIFILLLTIIWLIPVASLASLLNLCSIERLSPRFALFLSKHEILRALVQTGAPTAVVSLLNVLVPFMYDWLANKQGSISQSDVELSVISKNFFFTFFNVFVVFTVFGTASQIWPVLQDSLKDATKIAYNLATSLQKLGIFYTNFIMLQGIGLFPMRLLEFGSVSLYPIMLWGAKTPRDYAELVQPPVFKYGFYLPTSLLVFILCIVYSILPAGFLVLLFGLIYFTVGYFTYKYQLLYAMDHPQHATGAAWTIISYRIMLGLGIFQLAMAGVIALKQNFTAAALVTPLLGFTVWFSFFYEKTYEPLTKYIALRSIRRGDEEEVNIADEYVGIHRPPGNRRRRSMTVDEDRERGMRFVNPSLATPLEKVWINQSHKPNQRDAIQDAEEGRVDPQNPANPERVESGESSSSQLSLGDTHIWRDSGNGPNWA